jgi:hypothetical protein
LDFDLLARGADAVYRGLAVQLAKQYLLVPNSSKPNHNLNSTLSYGHQRLFVQLRPLRIIEATSAALILVSVFLAFRQSFAKTPPQDTASLARLSSAISQSRDLVKLLSATGSWPLRSMQDLLQGQYESDSAIIVEGYETVTRPFAIEVHGTSGAHSNHLLRNSWKPLMLSWYTRLALLAIP